MAVTQWPPRPTDKCHHLQAMPFRYPAPLCEPNSKSVCSPVLRNILSASEHAEYFDTLTEVNRFFKHGKRQDKVSEVIDNV